MAASSSDAQDVVSADSAVLGDLRRGSGRESSAVQKRLRDTQALRWPEAGSETMGCLMLVEVTEGGVPESGAVAIRRPLTDGVGDTLGWVASELARADATVVRQLGVDVV